MQGDVPTEDLIAGSIILAVFLVCVYAAGCALSRVRNQRFARAWAPLVPVINGKITQDGGGAATSWLTGTWSGRQVCATMVPNRNRYSGETGFRFNYFDVTLLDVPGKLDWSLDQQLVSTDDLLRRRLRDAGVATILTRLGTAEVTYSAKRQTLTIIQESGSKWVPSVDHFRAQLNVLLDLAAVNAALNSGEDVAGPRS